MPYDYESNLNTVGIQAIIIDLCVRAGIAESDLVFEGLDAQIYGYQYSPRDAVYKSIEELCALYNIDILSIGGRLHFKKRDTAFKTFDIAYGDLIVENQGEAITKESKKDKIEVPKKVIFEYFDIGGEIDPFTQINERANPGRSTAETKIQTNAILDKWAGVEASRIAVQKAKEETSGIIKFSTSAEYIGITVGDVGTIDNLKCLIKKIEFDDDELKFEAEVLRGSAFVTIPDDFSKLVEAREVPPIIQVEPPTTLLSGSRVEFIDSHIISDRDDALGFYIAASPTDTALNWRGCNVDLSFNGGADFEISTQITDSATIGTLQTELAVANRYLVDDVNSVIVEIDPSRQLLSATFEQVLNRSNLAIVGDELINFMHAEELSPGVWQLSGFLRGRKNSSITAHPAGSRFVLMRRQDLQFVPAEIALLNRDLVIRSATFGATDSDLQTVNFAGRSQIEAPPAYLTAERVGGQIMISWVGVGRLGGGNGVHGRFFGGYRATVNGVVYNTTSSTLAITDNASSYTIQVQQVNQITGAGPAAEVYFE